jgi:hypothetical protein
MATDNLLTVDIISAVIQSGNGVPNHIGTRGTIYINVDTGMSYQNMDNINTWLKFLYEGDASGAGGISGSGTINYIPKWSSASGLTNSRIFDDGVLITLSGNTNIIGSLSATTYYGDGSNLTGINSTFVTGGTYNSSAGTLTFINSSGGSFNVSGTYSFENSAYKQNSMAYDSTGVKYPTVDAVNLQANNLAKATTNTGFIDVNDTFTLYKYDNNTLGISGSSGGIVFKQLFSTPPFAPSSAIVQLSSRLVPLSSIGLTSNTNVIKFVGYRQSDDSIIFGDTSFIQSPNTCQLGVVLVKYSGGITSFIDNDRTFVNQPDISAYNNLETTGFGLKSNVIVNNLTNNLRIKNTGGNLIGISVNWHGNNNDLLQIVASESTGTTFTYIYPGNSITATPPTTAIQIDPTQYWNGTNLVVLANNNNATVQRFLLTIRGTIVTQYSELFYPDFATAQANATVQKFTDILPYGTAIEIGRLIITKNAVDLSDETKAHFIITGGGGGGGTSNVTVWGTITGNIFDQTDLVDNFQQKLTNPVTGTGSGTTNTLTKWNSSSGITDSNITDDGTLVTINSNTNVVGSITGNSFVVSGGTSDQFLKADGSTDSTTYTDGIFQQNITVSLSGGKTMGKYTNGQVIPAAGRTFEQVIRDIAIEYQLPSFASFSISSQSTLIEVGTALSGTKSFTWSFNNTFNVSANTMSIIDVTSGNTVLRSGVSITPPIVIDIGTKNNITPITQSWKGTAIDTNATPLTSGLFTVTSIYPFFYGVSASAPTPNQALINSGAKSVTVSTGTINITFGASLQYLWFAIPQSSTDKTKWYVDALNNGNIGTGTDLFNNDTIVSVNSPTALWNGVNYRIYISTYATTTSGVMQLQN